ncbi:MAG: sigma 54-interacting transcriptional regulator [Desulfobacterium sp.]|nr:sigma 54-interacting transcriptional regulator [Desulfobacterium sp.]
MNPFEKSHGNDLGRLNPDHITSASMGMASLDQMGTITYCNPAFAEQLKITKGMDLKATMPELAKPLELALQKKIQTIGWLKSSKLLVCFSPMEGGDGTRPVFCSLFKDSSSFVENFLKTETKALIIERDAIIDAVSEGIWVCDGKGKVLRVNPQSAKLNGIDPSDVIGKTMDELEELGLFKDCGTIEAIKERKTITRLVYLEKCGIKVLSTSKPIFDSTGKLVMVIGTERDITKLEALHQHLEEQAALQASFQLRLEELQDLNKLSDTIIAKSKPMLTVLNQVVKVSGVDSSVLILGESGVGKTVIAELIHKNSNRSQYPMLAINCAAIPESLIESELFGYVKGAFTGAKDKGKLGLIEMANKGTLILDEIAELSMASQSKLLKFLDEGTILRIGSTEKKKVDVRIIAATNSDLKGKVEQDKFRLDLYYRLNVISITVPPLRDRNECILYLIKHYINHFAAKMKTKRILSPKAIKALVAYNYPGNIRELINICERIVVMTDREYIMPGDLPFTPVNDANGAPPETNSLKQGETLTTLMERVERSALAKAREQYGSQDKMARALGVTQPTINRKMRKYGLS